MLPPKSLFDSLTSQVNRLFEGAEPGSKGVLESQLNLLLQSAFSRLNLVSREEFDSQMVVLARTRARLEALEAKVAELEQQLGNATSTAAEAKPATTQPSEDTPAATE